ncbi:MAG: nitrilase-related carbon-nitrogen hydrolase [bacterium]
MILAVLQFNPLHGKIFENYKTIENYLEKIQNAIVVLPEMSTTGYLFENKEELFPIAEEIPQGKFTNLLINTAKKNNLLIIAGVAEKENNNLYNSAIIVSPTGFIGKYRKVNLFYKEKFVFQNGEKFELFKVNFLGKEIKLGIMICFDWFFPEVCRQLKIKGAEVIAHPANLVLPYCPSAMPIRALENKVYTITSNRIGIEIVGNENLEFIGQSVICSPNGKYLLKLDKQEVGIFKTETNLEINENITKYNNLRQDLEKLYSVLK